MVEHSVHTRSVICSSQIAATRPVGQAVKTPPFHGGNMGSIPVRVTKKRRLLWQSPFFAAGIPPPDAAAFRLPGERKDMFLQILIQSREILKSMPLQFDFSACGVKMSGADESVFQEEMMDYNRGIKNGNKRFRDLLTHILPMIT